MPLSSKTQKIYDQLSSGKTMLGDLRKIAKEIKKDHDLASELWETEKFHPRMLAILIMDSKKLNEPVINKYFKDMASHPSGERTQLADWLMVNQLTKNKTLIELMLSWQNSELPLQRRIFWYYQGRLRWMGQTPPDNTEALLNSIEKNILAEEPEVQWAMNFIAGWVGVYNKDLRGRCVQIGETTGLYKDEIVPKNCTPNYLPKFIEIEAGKRKL